VTAGLPSNALDRAQRLAAIVHGDGGPDEVAQLLTGLDREALYALCVALAAMVDVDRTVAELLAWYEKSQGNKRCASCGEWLDRSRFASDRSRPDRLNPYCRRCCAARAKARYQRKRPAKQLLLPERVEVAS